MSEEPERSPLDWIDRRLGELDRRHLRRRLMHRVGRQDVQVVIDGDELTNFASNDYLGLATDPRLAIAALAAVEHFGWGAGASPLVTGHSALHQQLEARIAKFEGTEAALLFPTGYTANVGAIAALVGKGDHVFSDAKNHASIVDGCRLSRANTHVFDHCNVEDLRRQLEQTSGSGKKLIVTDGLFSMGGDIAPLGELAVIAEQHDAMLMVDEAHATGVLGASGRGTAELCGVDDRIHIRVGTLSKALGTFGGFVAGSRLLIDWLINRSRPYVYSTAAPPSVVAAGLAAFEIINAEPERRTQLRKLADHLRARLTATNLNVGPSTTQIIPVLLGDPETTMRVAAELRDRRLIVPGIRPPSVPPGESLLRISLSSAHTMEMVDELADILIELIPATK